MMSYRKIRLLLLIALAILIVTVSYLARSEAARPMVAWGSKGEDVRVLQWKLNQWGYYDGPVDGVFGTATTLSVRDFQRKNRLRVDGVVGPETWAALGYHGVSTMAATAATPVAAVVNRNDNVQLIAHLVHAEAGGEPYEGQVAVAAVLLNRVDSPSFPNSISGVIYQPMAFESVANGLVNTSPTNENVRAARSAVNGWDPTHGALFFWNPSKPVNRWIWSRPIIRRIGDHVFAR